MPSPEPTRCVPSSYCRQRSPCHRLSSIPSSSTTTHPLSADVGIVVNDNDEYTGRISRGRLLADLSLTRGDICWHCWSAASLQRLVAFCLLRRSPQFAAVAHDRGNFTTDQPLREEPTTSIRIIHSRSIDGLRIHEEFATNPKRSRTVEKSSAQMVFGGTASPAFCQCGSRTAALS